MNQKIINLTPHSINIIDKQIPPSGKVARVSVTSKEAGTFAGIPLKIPTFGDVVDLPDPEPNTMFIVSALVRSACPKRKDLASPSDMVRDEDGRIIGCRALDIN